MKISTHTQTRMAAKALFTAGISAKWVKTPAMTVMMTREGNTTPRVATTPPREPATLYPMKVAVFTAMTPGVHCPTA